MADNHFKIHKGVNLAPQATEPTNPSNGDQYYDSVLNKFRVYQNGSWLDMVNSSLGGINYILNPDAENNDDGWAEYGDAAGTQPVDGTGGSASISFARNAVASFELRGDAKFIIAKGLVDAQGSGVSYDFVIDEADRVNPKPLRISFDYRTNGSFDFGDSNDPVNDPSDIVVYIYDIDNAELIQPAPFSLDGSGTFIGEFQTRSDSSNYRLILHVATTNASAWDFYFDNVSVGPNPRNIGFAAHDEKDFTPTGSWTTNSTYTGNYSRIGRNALINVKITLAGAPNAASLTINMPPGLSIDDEALEVGNGFAELVSSGIAFDNNASRGFPARALYNGSTTSFRIDVLNNTTATHDSFVQINATTPFTFANLDTVEMTVLVPIQGWSSNTQVSSDADTRVVAMTAYNSATSITADTTIPTWTLEKDTHGAFNATTGVYTVPVSGWYSVYCIINTTLTTATDTGQIRIYKNGSRIKDGLTGNGEVGVYDVNSIFYYNAGDTIDIRPSVNRTVETSTTNSHLSIHRLAGPAQIAASETVACKYTSSTTALGTTTTTVVYPTKIYDTHGSYNPSTGVFTAPMSGKYRISGGITSGTAVTSSSINRGAFTDARKNGSILTRMGSFLYQITTGALQPRVFGDTVVDLLAGETLELVAIRNSEVSAFSASGSASNDWIAIERIGN